jgi:hypothetical protein
VLMNEAPRPLAFADLVQAVAKTLRASGWKVTRCCAEPDAAWHVVAYRATRWRVVQVVAPATVPAVRQAGRLRLSDAARLSARAGSMEQWLAHIRPDGRPVFGPHILTSQRWIGDTEPGWLQSAESAVFATSSAADSPGAAEEV